MKNYDGYVETTYKGLIIGPDKPLITHLDSSQCALINNSIICSRNIFNPEAPNNGKPWDIKKLTKKEFIITISLQNNYKIALSQ